MFGELIRDVIEFPSPSSTCALFDFCLEKEKEQPGYLQLPEISRLIVALHFSQWDELNVQTIIAGKCEALSNTTFVLFAHAIKQPEDLNTFNMETHCPLVHLRPRWTHEPLNLPVAFYSMQRCMDSLEGLQWLMFSDLFMVDRPKQWLRQCRLLYDALVIRVCYFIANESHDPGVCNVDEYTTVSKHSVYTPINVKDAAGYDSDDEKHQKYRTYIENMPDFSRLSELKANVNRNFLCDADSWVSGIAHAFLKYETTAADVEQCPTIGSVSSLRAYIFSRCKTLNNENTVDHFRQFYADLVITKADKRVFHRKNPHSRKTNLMHLLVMKDETLESWIPSSFEEIISRPVYNCQAYIRLSTDALFSQVCSHERHDPLAYLLDLRTEPSIYRDPVRNQWIASACDRKVLCPSLVAAFVFIRHAMIANSLPSLMEETELGVFDEHINFVW